ncbi:MULTISPECIES: M64 family metallopeptidase [unclassified Streptomyces]|uniref:M64 family metallopeptidase n=1 Tax=unclassified Streptomyces TaxID=2593676 RepID=UPI002ED3C4F4|nr:M64 family metallopeptidase [Streptomyces sp. NBC_00891]WSY04058.1 M64 family metallopeptidase [Streptomyces sp. NBC_00890]WSZ05684.1 M64 family metallopeptidase [Streptomyces sp. NBC_00869]WSZ26820.1 M64 family metallopeptidase [Streptomyces sp. NBC_00870]
MHTKTVGALSASVALMALLGAALAAPASAADPEPTPEPRVGVEYFPEPGGAGHRTEVPLRTETKHSSARTAPSAASTTDGTVGRLSVTGSSDDRLDVVIVGDGYTADEQEAFHSAAAAKWADITAIEPYASYQGLMNVWTVDAVSAESGISGDPTADVARDTALGSYFWCSQTERLICADIDKVASYAAKAPDADLVVVVSHSTKYGGAGYSGLEAEGYPFDGVSTLSSDNEQSSMIAAHEIAHSVGLLADEYTYDSYGTWTGGELPDINSSIYTAEQMAANRSKWYRWLGETDPTGGTVGTYEGSSYYPYGINRPSANSIMRALDVRDFNLPGREAMIAGFYREANALSSGTPSGTTIRRTDRIKVTRAALGGLAAPELRWYVDGVRVKRATGLTATAPSSLGVPSDGRTHTVTVESTDRTKSIRDPEVLAAATERLTWKVKASRR